MPGGRRSDLAPSMVAGDRVRVPAGLDPARRSRPGMGLVQRPVTSDLRGTFDIRTSERGTVATLTFPVASEDGDDGEER